MKLTVYICPKNNDFEHEIFSTELYEPFTKATEVTGDALLGCKVVRSLLAYKQKYYKEFCDRIRDNNDNGRQQDSEKMMKDFFDRKLDYFQNYEKNLVKDTRFFIRMAKYDIDIAPIVLYGYLSEINWKYYDLKVTQE